MQWLVGSVDVGRRSLAAEMFTQKNKISLAEILHCNLHNNSYASNKNILTEICTTIWLLQFLRKHSYILYIDIILPISYIVFHCAMSRIPDCIPKHHI